MFTAMQRSRVQFSPAAFFAKRDEGRNSFAPPSFLTYGYLSSLEPSVPPCGAASLEIVSGPHSQRG